MPFEPIGLPEHALALGAGQAPVQLGARSIRGDAVEVEEVEIVEHAGVVAVGGHLARRSVQEFVDIFMKTSRHTASHPHAVARCGMMVRRKGKG